MYIDIHCAHCAVDVNDALNKLNINSSLKWDKNNKNQSRINNNFTFEFRPIRQIDFYLKRQKQTDW